MGSMTLREKRCRFTVLKAHLILWINMQGWEVNEDEGMVHSPRKMRGYKDRLQDGVHKQNSFHYKGLAMDLNVFYKGKYISDGNDPIWTAIITHWKSLHPECTGGFSYDRNHISWGER